VPEQAILIAEVELDGGGVATSVPMLPRRFVPRVRPFAPLP
jgi:hypothetical protein